MTETTSLPEARGHGQCSACGSEQALTAKFCGACGAQLEHAVPAVPGSLPTSFNQPSTLIDHPIAPSGRTGQTGRNRPSRQLTVTSLLVAALVILAAIAGYVQYQTQSDLDSTRQELGATKGTLESTSRDLAETTEELAASQGDLSDVRGQLAEAQSDLRRTRERLQAALTRATGLESSLDDASNRLDLQASQIATLQSCLNGVSNALGYLIYENFQATIAALQAVKVSCNRASEIVS